MRLVSKTLRMIGILALALALSAPSAGRTIHWVLDIDHVLLDYPGSITGRWRDQSSRTLFEVNGHPYFLEEGAQGLLQYLADTPDSDLSFFTAENNSTKVEAFLTAVKVHRKDGRAVTLKEAAQGRILDGRAIEHVTNEAGDTVEIKDMSKLFPNPADREMVVWLDDTATNATGEEWKNMVLIKRLGKKELSRATPSEKVQELNKLSRTAGLLERFLARLRASNGSETPRDILPGLQWNLTPDGARMYRMENLEDLSLYRSGYRILKGCDPTLKFVPVNDPLRCREQLTPP
jgi:hypothetical protein